MAVTHAKADPWADVPGEMRRLQQRLAGRGVTLTLSNAGPADPLPELVVPKKPAAVGAAVVEEREERNNAL